MFKPLSDPFLQVNNVPTLETRILSRRKAAGFSLLELLVVLLIIGLLAGYVGPQFFRKADQAKVEAARAQLDALGKALDQFRLDTGKYPTTEQGLASLMTQPEGLTRWQGPYLKKAVPPDPWDRPYGYKSPGEHGEYDLYTYGADGKAGGEGLDADITNW